MKISLYNSSKMQLEADYYVKMLKEAGFNAVDFSLEDAWSRPKFWQGIIPELFITLFTITKIWKGFYGNHKN